MSDLFGLALSGVSLSSSWVLQSFLRFQARRPCGFQSPMRISDHSRTWNQHELTMVPRKVGRCSLSFSMTRRRSQLSFTLGSRTCLVTLVPSTVCNSTTLAGAKTQQSQNQHHGCDNCNQVKGSSGLRHVM